MKKFKDLTIRDAFMFAAVMSDPEICRRVLELAIGISIAEVHVQTEKTMVYHSEYHGVRLDVYAADEARTRFNVEMQVSLQKYLPKRGRYYHAQLDMDALRTGESYEALPNTYVIFICDFDPFTDGLYRYSTGTLCRETGKMVNDGVETIYLNAYGQNQDEVPAELVQFLNYVKDIGRIDTSSNTDPFVRNIEKKIDDIKQNHSMEDRYMLLEEMLRDNTIEVYVKNIIMSLEHKFPVSDELKNTISSEKNVSKLEKWFALSLNAKSLEEFEQKMN